MYMSSRHKQHIINISDKYICYKKSTVSDSSNEKLLGVPLTNTICWDTTCLLDTVCFDSNSDTVNCSNVPCSNTESLKNTEGS